MATKWTKKKRSRRIQAVIFIIALAVFLFSGYQLLKIYLEYKKGSDEYEKLAGEAARILSEAEDGQALEDGSSAGNGGGQSETGPFPWEELDALMRGENEDYVGWITIPDTQIDYPIVQFTDNDYYLAHTFEGTENAAGTLFVDSNIPEGMEGKNVIVYGHNMKNGSMFAGLKKYREDDFYEGHKTFRVNTKTGFYTYEIFAVTVVSPDSDTYTLDFADDAQFLDYIASMQERSLHNTGVTVEAGDKIITLSTCVNKNVDRLVVQAKRLEN
ncbi:MAG: class B sortase [Lachnospiraceae bacterium]|jgi:sortase B|nr:class B sortase [Lachnospiraceae bacterium]